MGRPRIFQKHDLPSGVVAVAVAVISDYDRRAREIKKGTLPRSLLSTYEKYNGIVEEALSHVEEPARAQFLSDISAGRGYGCSMIAYLYNHKAYYIRKREIIYLVAKGMGLTE